MRWWPLVLALLAGRATAGPCGDDTVFPANGATGVPLQTFVWIRPQVPGPYVLTSPNSRVELSPAPSQQSALLFMATGLLEPDHEYTLTANGVVLSTFTTGHDVEAELPPPPVVGHLRLTDGEVDMPVWSRGAAMLHVSLHRDQPGGEQLGEVWIQRNGLTNADLAACTGVTVKLGDSLCFWVSSVGYSGRESGVTGRCAVDKPRPKRGPIDDTTAFRREREPLPPRVILLVVAAVLALLFAAWRAGRERLYAKVCDPQPIDRISVAWLARRQLIRRLIALGAVAAAAYVVLPIAALGVIVVADLWRLVRVARAVATGWPVTADPPRSRAYVTDGLFFQGWISVRPGDLARVAAAHIPTARITRG